MISKYSIKSPKNFKPIEVNEQQLDKALDFAFQMVYGEGHHRAHRTGGSLVRKKGEQFCNTFQGKLAEIVLYDYITDHFEGFKCNEPDFSIMGKGVWDDTDLIINEKYNISIKSMAFFSNLLLLETKDWDTDGAYIPNCSAANGGIYDFFIIVRIKEDIKKIFRHNRLFFSDDTLKKKYIEGLINKEDWYFDIPGCASLETIKYLINKKERLAKGAILNDSISMDAENYFCEVSQLRPLADMFKQIKKEK